MGFMHGFSNKQKMVRHSWITVVVLTIVAATFFAFDNYISGQTTEESTLVFSTQVSGITEFSGLSIHSNTKEKLTLSMVGDGSPTLFEVTVDTKSAWSNDLQATSNDFGTDILKSRATCSSFQSPEWLWLF